MDADEAAAKRRLRAAIRAARAERTSGGSPHGLLSSALAAGLLDPAGRVGVVGPVVAAGYLAMTGEPDLSALGSAVRAAGGTVLLPIPLPGRAMGWARDDGRRGVAEAPVRVPIPGGPRLGEGARVLVEEQASLVLLPALAVDLAGGRLGQGGGYYDRMLIELTAQARAAATARPYIVAVVHDDELLEEGIIPVEPHDQPVDAALTPSRLVRLR